MTGFYQTLRPRPLPTLADARLVLTRAAEDAPNSFARRALKRLASSHRELPASKGSYNDALDALDNRPEPPLNDCFVVDDHGVAVDHRFGDPVAAAVAGALIAVADADASLCSALAIEAAGNARRVTHYNNRCRALRNLVGDLTTSWNYVDPKGQSADPNYLWVTD